MKEMKNKKIAVLLGGGPDECEVSIKSGEAVFQALQNMKYDAFKIYFDENLIENLQKTKPDVVFNALHGQFGEDGRVPSLLDLMGIDYTHSNYLTSAICMDKAFTKEFCRGFGVKMAKSVLIHKDDKNKAQKIAEIARPFVVKPIGTGSSVGVSIIFENDEFNIENYEFLHGDRVMVEKYVKGKEIQVAVFENRAIGVIEIRPKNLFYDYDAKYSGSTEYIMPAKISEEDYKKALIEGEKIHNAFNCKNLSRIDFILSEDGELYFLEINTHPGLTQNSLVPKIANYCQISFNEIVESLIKSAKCQKPKEKTKKL